MQAGYQDFGCGCPLEQTLLERDLQKLKLWRQQPTLVTKVTGSGVDFLKASTKFSKELGFHNDNIQLTKE